MEKIHVIIIVNKEIIIYILIDTLLNFFNSIKLTSIK